jgi:thioredoxin 1
VAIIVLGKDNFVAEALQSEMPMLVDFWADWCGPCKVLSPLVEEIASELEGRVRFGKLNVDEAPEIAGEYGIRSIPTLMLFKDGEVKATSIGVRPKAEIMKLFE